MVWKVGNDSIVFFLDTPVCEDAKHPMSCEIIREKACAMLSQQGIKPHGSLEIKLFSHGNRKMVFASYIEEKTCRMLYHFFSVDALLDAYQTEILDDCTLIYYDGDYYAALFREGISLCEYAQMIPNAKNYYTFLSEHGKILS